MFFALMTFSHFCWTNVKVSESDCCGEDCGEEVEKSPKALNLLDKMVEPAGIEPASANPPQQVLHT